MSTQHNVPSEDSDEFSLKTRVSASSNPTQFPDEGHKENSPLHDLSAVSHELAQQQWWWQLWLQSLGQLVQQFWRWMRLHWLIGQGQGQGEHPNDTEEPNTTVTMKPVRDDISSLPDESVTEIRTSESESQSSDTSISIDRNGATPCNGSRAERNQNINTRTAGSSETECDAQINGHVYECVSIENEDALGNPTSHSCCTDGDTSCPCHGTSTLTNAAEAASKRPTETPADRSKNTDEVRDQDTPPCCNNDVAPTQQARPVVSTIWLSTPPSPISDVCRLSSKTQAALLVYSPPQKIHEPIPTVVSKQAVEIQSDRLGQQAASREDDHSRPSDSLKRHSISEVPIFKRVRWMKERTRIHRIQQGSFVPPRYVLEALRPDGDWMRLSPAQLELVFVPARRSGTGHAELHFFCVERVGRVVIEININEEHRLELILYTENAVVIQLIGSIELRILPLVPSAAQPRTLALSSPAHRCFWKDATRNDQCVEEASQRELLRARLPLLTSVSTKQAREQGYQRTRPKEEDYFSNHVMNVEEANVERP